MYFNVFESILIYLNVFEILNVLIVYRSPRVWSAKKNLKKETKSLGNGFFQNKKIYMVKKRILGNIIQIWNMSNSLSQL
jgi:hypothetical protein